MPECEGKSDGHARIRREERRPKQRRSLSLILALILHHPLDLFQSVSLFSTHVFSQIFPFLFFSQVMVRALLWLHGWRDRLRVSTQPKPSLSVSAETQPPIPALTSNFTAQSQGWPSFGMRLDPKPLQLIGFNGFKADRSGFMP